MKNLKSSMDRFIAVGALKSMGALENLKSSMDRFIVTDLTCRQVVT